MKSEIQFVNEKVKRAFDELDSGKYEEKELKNFIIRAFTDIEENPFCGIQVSKRLIPKEYVQKYNVKNVWKYNLPNAWRLVYSIERGNLSIISIILEWLDHKTYERRFGY